MWDAENVKMFAYFRPDWHDNESHPISSGSTYNSRSSEVREAIYWFLVYCYCLGYFPANCRAGMLKHINYIHTNSWFWLWVERRNYFWVTLNGQLLSWSLRFSAFCILRNAQTLLRNPICRKSCQDDDMGLLRWFLMACYAVARVFWVVAHWLEMFYCIFLIYFTAQKWVMSD